MAKRGAHRALVLKTITDNASVTLNPELGRCTLEELTLTLLPGAKPFRRPSYRIPMQKRAFVEKEIADLIKSGRIVPSASPWAAPLVVVSKPTEAGEPPKFRMAVDYRGLNQTLTFNAVEMPSCANLISDLGAFSGRLSALDLASAGIFSAAGGGGVAAPVGVQHARWAVDAVHGVAFRRERRARTVSTDVADGTPWTE